MTTYQMGQLGKTMMLISLMKGKYYPKAQVSIYDLGVAPNHEMLGTTISQTYPIP